MTISLLLIATNKYKQFVEQLLLSADKYFFAKEKYKVDVFLFTDDFNYFEQSEMLDKLSERINVILLQIPAYKFPYATLYRYKIFDQHRNDITGDYVFYADVDTRFVDYVGIEILPDSEEGKELIAVPHCGFHMVGGGSWGNNKESTSYTEPEKRVHYVMGGFQGGKREAYLRLSRILKIAIETDEGNKVLAEHNDETHFNKYFSEKIEKFKLLTPSYCMVEQQELREQWKVAHFPAKLIALNKNHEEIRN